MSSIAETLSGTDTSASSSNHENIAPSESVEQRGPLTEEAS